MVYDYSKFKSLELNDEEINAIQEYIGPFHTSLNSVLDVDPKVILMLMNKGWLIDLSKEKIAQNIDVLEKIYSAMYKQSKVLSKYPNTLYRGTSINEVEMLQAGKQYSRFLSTSQDKEISKRFSEYNNGAIVNVKMTENVPYLIMDRYLDETSVSEEEILIAPYSKVKSIKKDNYFNNSSFSEYDMVLEKQEYKEIDENEREKCEKEIYSLDVNKELDEYNELEKEVEMLYERKKLFSKGMSKDDFKDFELLEKEIEEKSSKLEITAGKLKTFRENMSKYLQDKFKTIEIGIDKEIQKEEKEQDEKYRVNRIQEIKDFKANLIQKANEKIEFVSNVRKDYSELDDEEVELSETAKNTGAINTSTRNIENDNVSKFTEVIQNIEEIKKSLEKIEINDNMTIEELENGGIIDTMAEKDSQIEITKKLMDECEKSINVSKNLSKDNARIEIGKSVENALVQKTLSDIIKQRDELKLKKDSVLDKITGKAKLKQAKIENLDSRLECIKNGGLNIPTNDYDKLKEYVTKYSKIIGIENLPKEAKPLLQDNDVEISESEKARFDIIINGNLPQVVDKKISNRKMALNIKDQTEKINNIASVNEKPRKMDEVNSEDYIKVDDALDILIEYTRDDGKTLEQKKEELHKNITRGRYGIR